MNLFRRWFWPLSLRNTALSHYKLGILRTEKKDSHGAMEAFTMAIEQPGAPEDVKAMALYNRALLFAALHDAERALVDLRTIMTMRNEVHGVKLAAKRRLERLQHRLVMAARSEGPSHT